MGKKKKKNNKKKLVNNKIKEKNNLNNKNNQTADIYSFDNKKEFYNNPSDEINLEESKKNDIQDLFDLKTNKYDNKKINKWKISTIFLVIISLVLFFLVTNAKDKNYNKNDKSLCEIEKENNISNNENKNKELENEKNPKEKKYLFLGDSLFYLYNTTEYFRDYNTVNSGINGITASQTYDVLKENVYDHNPDVIFILLGTNDLYHVSPLQAYENLKLVIDKIHSDKPEITINVISLLPINTTDHEKISKEMNYNRTNEKVDEVNKYLKVYCDEKNINFINVHNTLLDEEGNLKLEYTTDGLHVNDIGYHFITNILLKYFE